jgi:8-oxo-dGTP pyrophosphatase MutT (NUDIX family)
MNRPEGMPMRQSEAALAIIRRPGRSSPEYLTRWNEKWQALNFVGGHRHLDESFRDCMLRELAEELGPAATGARVGEKPLARLEYTAFSKSAGQDTAYVMELFDVELVPAALAAVSADPANCWLSSEAVLAGRAGDGRAVSDTVRLLLQKTGLLPAGE